MIQYLQALLNLHRDEERGASAVEYGLLVALIAVFIIGALTFLGGALDGLFREIGAAL